MRHRRGLSALVAILALALLVAACEADEEDVAEVDDPDELPEVVFQELANDPASLPLHLMKAEGLDEEYGFRAEAMVVDPADRAAIFLTGESDIGVERDIVDLTIAQQEGHEAVAFYPTLELLIGIVTAEDAEFEEVQDLEGATVGHFGVDSGTTQTHAVMLEELYGIDVFSDFSLEEAGPGALPDLLTEGRVDAYMNFEPLLVRGIVEAPGRYLWLPYEEWSQDHDWVPYLTYLAARSEWIADNPDLALNLKEAWAEAADMIKESDYELLRDEPALEEHLALPTEEHLDTFIEFCQERMPCVGSSWGQEDLDGAEEYLELVAELGGLIDEPPEEPVAVILEDYVEELTQ